MNYLLKLPLPVSLVTLILFGLIAGFFYAFSVDVMPGFDRIAPNEAIHAMQGINLAVRNPVFFVTFFLTPIAAFLTAGILYLTKNRVSSWLMVSAGAVYMLGAFAPTVSINVPMNDALAAIEIASKNFEAKNIWNDFSVNWTYWNTFRTIASTISLGLCGLAIYRIKK